MPDCQVNLAGPTPRQRDAVQKELEDRLARAQGDRKTEREKLEHALAIFTELKMPRERDAVQAELDKLGDRG